MRNDDYDDVMNKATIAIGIALVAMVIWFTYFAGEL